HGAGAVGRLRHRHRPPRPHRGGVPDRRRLELQGVPAPRMKILVVEDDKTVAQYVKRGLEEAGNHVDAAGDGEQGLTLASDGHYALLLLALRRPKTAGRDLYRTMGAR